MQGRLWTRVIALVVMVLLLHSPVAAQGIGGDSKGETDESTSDVVGPCVSDNRDDITDEEEAGLTGRRAYESPQFGYTVDWTRDWGLDDYFETPVVSKPETERDALCLYWSEGETDYGYMYVVGQVDSRGGADADVEEWTDPDYIEEQWPNHDVEVIIDDSRRDRGAVAYLIEDREEGFQYATVYLSIELADDSMIYITFSTALASFETAYEAVSEGVTIDGEPIFTLFDWDDIEAEL